MQLRKFYGRTLAGALTLVKRELGPDALILETRPIESNSTAGRMNPGSRFEVLAARAEDHSEPSLNQKPVSAQIRANVTGSLLEDLGILRSQIRELLAPSANDSTSPDAAGMDLTDYHGLISEGVDHKLLAPHFRAWLAWRTSSPQIRHYLNQQPGAVGKKMKGQSLREWLLHAWLAADVVLNEFSASSSPTIGGDKEVIGLVGPTGGGKTTTLCKLASIIRQERHKNVAIVTLDAQRLGATEQWRRWAKLMGVEVHEVASPKAAMESMEQWERFDWIGIDTPGGMTPDSSAGRLYGSILAQCPSLQTVAVIPVTHREAINRDQMKRSRTWGAHRVLFTKLDESTQHGEIFNLTAPGEGGWQIEGFGNGTRVPEDWHAATPSSLWQHVLAGTSNSVEGVA